MDILIRLLIVHFLVEFYLIPSSMKKNIAENSWRSPYLYLKAILTIFLSWLALWDVSLWYLALILGICTVLIQVLISSLYQHKLSTFIFKQVIHLIVIALVMIFLQDDVAQVKSILENFLDSDVLILVLSYMIITLPVGMIVGKATQKWRIELDKNKSEKDSLENAGIWIGVLERILVLTFVLLNHFQAIGFLIAAKSILRFSNNSKDNPRKQTEYVLIGTLLSFTIALAIGLLAKGMLSSS